MRVSEPSRAINQTPGDRPLASERGWLQNYLSATSVSCSGSQDPSQHDFEKGKKQTQKVHLKLSMSK